MKFGPLKPKDAKNGILAHSLKLPTGTRLRKGAMIDDEMIGQLSEAGIESVTVAMPQQGDVLEDAAATLIAQQLSVPNVKIEEAATGRVNIFAVSDRIFRTSAAIINAINAVDPTITIATLPDYAPVNQGRLIATIKIIPYAIKSRSLETVLALDTSMAIAVHKYSPKRIGMISTKLTALKPSSMDKTRVNLESRLALSGSTIVEEVRVEHDEKSIETAISNLSPECDMLVLFGASAISDIADCIPAAIENAEGEIIRFGMPVDPGNLMLLAKIGEVPVIGAPGCARSIAENGFDWVLQRLLADVPVTAEDIAGLGVGGLLMETGSRPHPREKSKRLQDHTSAIILAAGQSRRMGDINKMTVEIDGEPIVRHVASAAVGSLVKNTVVVTGHEQQDVLDVLNGLEVSQHHNPDFAEGLSTSLKCGIKALSKDVSNAIILLGDMPFVTSVMIDMLIKNASANPNHIIVATHSGKRGNPVLWPREYFEELCSIQGDVGARHIMAANRDRVIEVELGMAASLDLDTPQAVQMVQEKD